MISIKDYADKKGVTYEAVRRQVKRYREELDGHIVTKNRTRFLDSEAETFLDERRAANPLILYEEAKDKQIENLKRENDNLKILVMQLQDDMIKQQKELLKRDEIIYELSGGSGGKTEESTSGGEKN